MSHQPLPPFHTSGLPTPLTPLIGSRAEVDQLRLQQQEYSARYAHAARVLARVEPAPVAHSGSELEAWLARIETAHDDIRAALMWALESGQIDIALRLCAAVWRFWSRRGYLIEGRMWLIRALDAPGGEPSPARLAALIAAGQLAIEQHDADVAAARFAEAQRLADQLSDGQPVCNRAIAAWRTSRGAAPNPSLPSSPPEPTATPATSRADASPPHLTRREQDVLRLVAAGSSSREIADTLFISPRTASTHVEHILSKLAVKTRSAAVAIAILYQLM